MFRICMIVHKNYYHDTRVKRYAESLLGLGAKVDVICPGEKYTKPMKSLDGLRIYTTSIHHHQRRPLGLILEYILAFVVFFYRLSSLSIRNRYQIVHIHNMPDFLIFSGMVSKLFGAKLILDIHDPMPELFISKYGKGVNKFLYRLICWQEKVSCMFANLVITANSNFKENLIKRGVSAEKIFVINNYPNLNIFDRNAFPRDLNASRDRFVLIYPGTIAPRYGLDIPIKALPILINEIPQVCLRLIGPDNEYKNSLKSLAQRLEVTDYIEFYPLIPINEVPRYLFAANVGIYPAVCDAHMDIATPTKVFEFIAMGLPVVSSRLHIIEQIFNETDIAFFEPGSVDDFASQVIKIYSEPEYRETLVKNTYRIIKEKNSWDQEFLHYVNILHSILPNTLVGANAESR